MTRRALSAVLAALVLTSSAATAAGHLLEDGAPSTPQIGSLYSTPGNVAAIVTRTAAIGWPHRLNRAELSGLGRMLSRAVYPVSRHRTGDCRYHAADLFCGATEILSHTFVYLRVVHVWGDGTAAARVVAVVR